MSYCFHSDSELSYGKAARLTARLILAVILQLICLTSDHVSGILDTTDTNFLPPWAGGASNLYNIISIHSEKNVGWILHEDNGPNHPMIHLNVKCGYIL